MVYTHLAAAIVAAAIASVGTWQVQSWRHDSAELTRIEGEREAKRMREKAATTAGIAFEQDKEKVRIVYEVIDKSIREIVERPVYRNVCLDPDGLRQLESAIERTRAPGELAATVPSADPATGREGQ